MLTSEQKLQLQERKAELARRRQEAERKARAREKQTEDPKSSMLASRTQKEESEVNEVTRAFNRKAAMMSRHDELSTRAVQNAKRAAHESQLWHSPDRQRSPQGMCSEKDASSPHYAFVKGAVAPAIREDTYARLMNCGSGRTVLTHLQSRHADQTTCQYINANNSLSLRSPSATFTPSSALTPMRSPSERLLSATASSPPAYAAGVKDTYVLQYSMVHGKGDVQWK